MEVPQHPQLGAILTAAEQKATGYNYLFIHSGFLLWAILDDDENVAVMALRSLGHDTAEIADTLVATWSTQEVEKSGSLARYDREVQAILSLCNDVAVALSRDAVDITVLFLAIAESSDSVGRNTLRQAGVELGRLRAAVEAAESILV